MFPNNHEDPFRRTNTCSAFPHSLLSVFFDSHVFLSREEFLYFISVSQPIETSRHPEDSCKFFYSEVNSS